MNVENTTNSVAAALYSSAMLTKASDIMKLGNDGNIVWGKAVEVYMASWKKDGRDKKSLSCLLFLWHRQSAHHKVVNNS